VVGTVAEKSFLSLEKEVIHNQIRYFTEVFTLQWARKFPSTFSNIFVSNIIRRDLSLQMISSLMIIGGNLIVGKYQSDFFRAKAGKKVADIDLNIVLGGVIPWLSSTQGFSRAIAQLLVHKLIPLVTDIVSDNKNRAGDDWYLRSVYRFLEENPEMKRLRKKQSLFFNQYDVDPVCTPEGVLAIPVDEGGEADPIHMIDIIKECLQNVYDEGHIDDAPTWRKVEHMLETNQALEAVTPKIVPPHQEEVVNFQRKIIPVDALNLALEDMREKKLRNAAGRKKRDLIVCATLIEKIPNLGGLARTSEIFAASKLIVPDIRLTKMDNFKNITVGAHDWIDIEECREEVRCFFGCIFLLLRCRLVLINELI
jgi:tRNA guanosine-2'-O-methyltransferase